MLQTSPASALHPKFVNVLQAQRFTTLSQTALKHSVLCGLQGLPRGRKHVGPMSRMFWASKISPGEAHSKSPSQPSPVSVLHTQPPGEPGGASGETKQDPLSQSSLSEHSDPMDPSPGIREFEIHSFVPSSQLSVRQELSSVHSEPTGRRHLLEVVINEPRASPYSPAV